MRGVEIAIDDKNKMLLGHPIELTGEDTGCNPEGGQAAAQKLAADKTIVAVVGTSCSSEARVAAPILTDAGLTLISASNTAPDLTSAAKHVAGYMRTAHNDEIQGAVAAEFAYYGKGITRAATIHDGSLYAQSLQAVFAKRFLELGGEIVAQEAVGPTDTDMRPVLTTIASATPELIYFPIFTASGGFVTSQSKEVPGLEKVKLMGADGIFSPDFLKAAGAAALGMYHSSPDFSAFAEGYAAFLEKHQAKYGEKPLSAFHAHGYDAANIIFAAIEKVGVQDADGTLHIGRQALRDAMFATKDFKGITGTLTCTPLVIAAIPRLLSTRWLTPILRAGIPVQPRTQIPRKFTRLYAQTRLDALTLQRVNQSILPMQWWWPGPMPHWESIQDAVSKLPSTTRTIRCWAIRLS